MVYTIDSIADVQYTKHYTKGAKSSEYLLNLLRAYYSKKIYQINILSESTLEVVPLRYSLSSITLSSSFFNNKKNYNEILFKCNEKKCDSSSLTPIGYTMCTCKLFIGYVRNVLTLIHFTHTITHQVLLCVHQSCWYFKCKLFIAHLPFCFLYKKKGKFPVKISTGFQLLI